MECCVTNILKDRKCCSDLWIEDNDPQHQVERSLGDSLLQHIEGLMARVGSLSTYWNGIHCWCSKAGWDDCTELNLWFSGWIKSNIGTGKRSNAWKIFHFYMEFIPMCVAKSLEGLLSWD